MICYVTLVDMETIKYRKGETYALDQVIKYISVIPNDTFDQDDPSDYTITGDNDSGETIRFIKNVTIKIDVKVT